MQPEDQDAAFFAALLAADTDALRRILTDDFLIVDVMTGSVTDRASFVDAVGSGAVTFRTIDRYAGAVRRYPGVAVVVGRTAMRGDAGGQEWAAASRYTHVYVDDAGTWRLASAQGTPIAE